MEDERNKLPFYLNTFLANANGGRTVSKYATNQTIYHQGDSADSVYYIQTGTAKLSVTSEQGKEAIVAMLGTGDFIGETCANGETVRLSTATALTECTIMRITQAEISQGDP